MMQPELSAAFITGYERMAAWSDLLDDINLYPVADADTGKNLRLSLSPLKAPEKDDTATRLLLNAKGNSGNIAGAFFSKFIEAETPDAIRNSAASGRKAAWGCLQSPKQGTMLEIYDALLDALDDNGQMAGGFEAEKIIEKLKAAVLLTAEVLPELRQAGVVDAGALGMFLFFDGFFGELGTEKSRLASPYQQFSGYLKAASVESNPRECGYCIDAVVLPESDLTESTQKIAGIGDHVVTVPEGRHLKIHLHADDEAAAKTQLSHVGDLVRWNSEWINTQPPSKQDAIDFPGTVHVATDAAGSITLREAERFRLSLLNSYIILDDCPLPETMVDAEAMYAAMQQGKRVSTAQASIFERHQCYQHLTQRYPNLIYVCVGSAYTGIYDTARQWSKENSDTGMVALDSGAASGRLGLIARHVARFASGGRDRHSVVQHAQTLFTVCDELVFLGQLKYLAAGGRISKSNGFFGDLLNIKPIIRPTAQGAQKVATVKTKNAQLRFAIDYLGRQTPPESEGVLMLQYTDNADWVTSCVKPQLESLRPHYRLDVQPMSLTSGAHMGPGTWALAFMPAKVENGIPG